MASQPFAGSPAAPLPMPPAENLPPDAPPPGRAPQIRLGVACLVGATVIFAFQDGITKYLASHYPIPFIVMVRYWAFALFAIALVARQPGGVKAATRSKRPILQSLRALLLVSEIGLVALAFRHMGLAEVQSIFAVYPLLVMAMAIVLLGERVGWRRWVATGVGFIGLLIIVRPGVGTFEPAALYSLASATMYALYTVLTRMVSADDSAGTTFLYTGVVGAILVTLFGGAHWTAMSGVDWGWMALLALFGMSSHFLLIKALEYAPASVLQPYNYLSLVWSGIVGYLVFHNIPDLPTFIGGAVIVGSGLYVLYRDRKVKGLR
ncbi:EamA family transporter [Rhodospirillum rubrum]|nr:DMT family transporter [Rhodospirillum rubrum]MBK1663920.1 EamA family transporter [Rhodospirillum rubrum]MBK1676083.1 EamA family transporter [Rhodospirillum rubrum]